MRTIARIQTQHGTTIVSGPDMCDQEILVNGRAWKFDFDRYCGPFWLKKDGNPRANQNPNKKVWAAFEQWQKENNL